MSSRDVGDDESAIVNSFLSSMTEVDAGAAVDTDQAPSEGIDFNNPIEAGRATRTHNVEPGTAEAGTSGVETAGAEAAGLGETSMDPGQDELSDTEAATTAATSIDSPDGAADAVGNRRGRWWVEILIVLVFYGVYSLIRNTFGSAAVSPRRAYDNAVEIIDLEKRMGLYFEEVVQGWFVDWGWFLKAWNIFYGTLHFIVTIGVLIWLFRRFPARHRLARNSLAVTTVLALIGFSTYPLMPPRLLAVGPPYGGLEFGGNDYAYVDSLAVHGGLWSFDSGAMQAVSNQYAAMPSLHFGWSAWCLIMLWPVLQRRWTKALIAAYPVATLFAIVVTANHYWIDAAGGALVLALGLIGGRLITGLGNQRAERRAAAALS